MDARGMAAMRTTQQWCRTQLSQTYEEMQLVIRQAQALNMSVVLKPHVDLKTGLWRANIGMNFNETQWGVWWGSYRAYMAWILRLAQATGVAAINIGTELCATEHRDKEWRNVVKFFRQSGWSLPLFYGTNWAWMQACPLQPHGCPGGPFNITWWDAVDAIGVDAYFPLAAAPGSDVPTLVLRWMQIIAPLKQLAQKFNRPLIFPEIGYASFRNATVAPYACCSGPVDLEAQHTAFAAFFHEGGPWEQVSGVFWWAWTPVDVPNPTCNTNFAIYGKPAQHVIAAAYNGTMNTNMCK